MRTSISQSLKTAAFAAALLIGLQSCNLENEIEIVLPEYNSRFSVECYLEPGNVFTLLLSKTAPYFEPFPTFDDQFLANILEDSATVVIRHNGQEYPLENRLIFNPFTGKLFNYINFTPIPEDYENNFELSITTKSGQTITATTRLLPKVPIDSVVVQFSPTDTLARVLTYFTDDLSTRNYYRRMLHFSSLDSVPRQDFALDDSFSDNAKFVFGTSYEFAEGDTVINTLFHIDKDYYDYFDSVQNAFFSNGNPFAQPSPINSNLRGTANAIGIFTGLSYDRVFTIVRR
jgi:hypothetical protein